MSMIRFIPVAEITDPLTITLGLSGASGTGKTYTALRVASGMAEGATGHAGAPVIYVDTENRRALHYRREFPHMLHLDFKATGEDDVMLGFGPNRWIEILDAAEREGATALILDSFSHAWEGIDGVLDRQAMVLDRLVAEAEKRANGRYTVEPEKFGQLSWAEVKPPYRRLIDRIVRANLNLVICTRAKPVMQKGFGASATNARKTKTGRADVPWDVAGDGDLIFEMTAMMMLDRSAPGCPVHRIKCADQFKTLFNPDEPMTEATGRAMAEWARNQGRSAAEKTAMDNARAAARRGTDAFRTFWNSDPAKEQRAALRAVLSECQQLAADADARAAATDDDPFPDQGPTPEQIERATAEAEAASKAYIERELQKDAAE